MNSPRFIAVFKPTRTIARVVEDNVVDQVVHIAYDDTGQRWGFVERVTGIYHQTGLRVPSRVARGWVKLPTQILNEEWPEGAP